MTKLTALTAALLAATTISASAYSTKDARYVWKTNDPQTLQYIVCLEGKVRGANDIQSALEKAARACAKQAPAMAADIRGSILECGFKKGDGSPDQGCR